MDALVARTVGAGGRARLLRVVVAAMGLWIAALFALDANAATNPTIDPGACDRPECGCDR